MTGQYPDKKSEKKGFLPDGWRWMRLGEVCEIIGGSTPRTGNPAYWYGDIVWITPTDLGALNVMRITTSSRKITKEGYESCGAALLPVGAVVLSSRAPIGYLGIAETPLCTNQGCKSFIPSDKVTSAFLYWQLKKSVPELQSLGSGATFKEISKTDLQNFIISLPPISEQKRIAVILNEQMEAIEKALKATEAQLEAAKTLPAAYLRAVFNSPEAKQWPRKKFEEVAMLQRGYDLPSQNQIYGNFPIMTSSGVSGYHNECKAKSPGVITGRSGSIGKVYFVEEDYWPHNTALYVKDFKDNEPQYIYFLLQWLDLKTICRGSGVPTLDRKEVHKVIVQHPEKAIQQRIAIELSERMASAERLRKSLESQLETINKLPAALLRQAFNGEL